MKSKIEMAMQEEVSDTVPHHHSVANDDAVCLTSSSSAVHSHIPVPGPGSQGYSSRPSSRASVEIQSGSAYEGTVSSTASSDIAESSQLSGGGSERISRIEHPEQLQPLGAGRGDSVATSSTETSVSVSPASSRSLSPSVGSSQPTALGKKRIINRPRFRGDDPPAPTSGTGEKYPASSSRGTPISFTTTKTTTAAADTVRTNSVSKPVTSTVSSGGNMMPKKSIRSDLYDFPDDSPDEDAGARPPSSYMALGTPGRSPRKGHVDSSDSSKGLVAPATSDGRADTSGIGSSVDERRGSGERTSVLGGKDGNEAQAYESYSVHPGGSHHQHRNDTLGDEARTHYRSRRESGDGVSSVSTVSVDSTHTELKTLAQASEADASETIDSSSTTVVSKRSSPRDLTSESGSYEVGESGQSRSMEGLGYIQHARSPRHCQVSADGGGVSYGGVDSSSTERSCVGPNTGSGSATTLGLGGYGFPPGSGSGQQVVSSLLRDPEHQVCSRDQEPAPILSSQYETLSDDDNS